MFIRNIMYDMHKTNMRLLTYTTKCAILVYVGSMVILYHAEFDSKPPL